ncbi:MAG: CBS domain-containing protein [Planctomycetota bacterium]|jgi:CBS domain-containing protein
MGEQEISLQADSDRMRAFTRALLEDVQALEEMLHTGRIESGIRRIGAEQELFLIDDSMRPAPVAYHMLATEEGRQFAPELAQFNIEINLEPHKLGGNCLAKMEAELNEKLEIVRKLAKAHDAHALMVGILPTLEQSHLGLDYMTPIPRFHQLNQVMSDLRGGDFRTHIKGVDELEVLHDNVMLEACNTSFQIHFQVGGDEFVELYNLAQMVTAPVIAAAVNSPVFLKHRLWKETRVALFQQSLDVRSAAHTARGRRARVTFGESWLKSSVLEIFRDDISRFRSLLSTDDPERSLEMLKRDITPSLKSLCLHNGTVYRWNRPCYGVKDNIPHLRIENRTLPAGPSIVDEVANAAFFFGLMTALGEEYGDVSKLMDFDEAKSNFMAASRYGLKAQLNWLGGEMHTAGGLILDHLLPLARQGLEAQDIDGSDIDRYLGVLEERVRRMKTGSQWTLDSLSTMSGKSTPDERYRAVTAAMLARQKDGSPVHEWELAKLEEAPNWADSFRTVAQVMNTDVFTVHPEDLVDLAASVMEWEHIRHVPVEDTSGRLVGLVSHRALLRMITQGENQNASAAVREIMKPDPVTTTPEASTLGAIETMKRHKVSCLPVVRDGLLVGIVTEADFIEVAGALLEEKLRES